MSLCPSSETSVSQPGRDGTAKIRFRVLLCQSRFYPKVLLVVMRECAVPTAQNQCKFTKNSNYRNASMLHLQHACVLTIYNKAYLPCL